MNAVAYSDNGTLALRTRAYGASQELSVVSDRADAADSTRIGTTARADAGVDVAGQIGGVDAVGAGQMLTGATGSPTEGLQIQVYASQAAIDSKSGNFGSVGFSKGALDAFIGGLKGILDPTDGLIKSAQEGYEASIKQAEERIERLEARLDLRREQLVRQFSAAEQAIAQLQAMMQQLAARTN